MIQIKRNLILSLEKRKKNGVLVLNNIPIRLRVNYAGKRVEVQTGYRVDSTKWDESKEKVKNGSFNNYEQSSADINAGLLGIKLTIQELFKDCEVSDRYPTNEDIKEVVKKVRGKKNKKDFSNSELNFFEVFDAFTKINGRMNSWSEGTFKKFSTVKEHLKNFRANLTFTYFNREGLTDYLVFLNEKKNMRNSSAKKHLGFLKSFLRWSYENQYHKNESYKSFHPKIKIADKPVIFLTEEEKKKIIELEIPETKKYLFRTRDMLMYLCYSGLRHSDAKNLSRSDIREHHMQITTLKTNDNLIIEFNKHTKAILEKYKHIPYPGNKALPMTSNQKMNEYLKELGELAGINSVVREIYYIGNERLFTEVPKYELISTHIGRRTFICTALAIGIPVQVVMKWTGHSDFKSMKPYIETTDKTKQIAMAKFDLL